MSIDKDLDMIRGWHYNFIKDKKYFIDDQQAIKHFYTQILTGDRVDNIIGLRGIGPKKAEKISFTPANSLAYRQVRHV